MSLIANETTCQVAPGVWRMRFAEPEPFTPTSLQPVAARLDALAARTDPQAQPPFFEESCTFRVTARGCQISLPFSPDEGIFGLGLQLKSHLQSGKKKQLRVNSDPTNDTGDSHAPVPFYVSSSGYGVLIDTARYLSIYIGTHARKESLEARRTDKTKAPALSTSELYKNLAIGSEIVVDIPVARGVDIYLFHGPDMLTAVRRYNLFCGGGCLPPFWGLGNWYRACARANADEVLSLAKEFKREDLPFSVMGLEPGWQTEAYPCSFVWSSRFPDPEGLIADLDKMGYRLNLWEHAFVHPDAPFAREIEPYCSQRLAMDGLVPDFVHPKAAEIFARHHAHLAHIGVSGFKLDECDNSDYIARSWSFPEHDQFPSGIDGEQAHSLYGLHYQQAVNSVFDEQGKRTYGLVRASGAMASALPYVLYSDLYEHADFIRGLVNAGFSGLLWSPEVRHAQSVEDLVRRLQTAVLSPLSQINGWYIPMPPWKQVNRALNEQGIEMPERAEAVNHVRETLKLRVRLLPYLYTAFARYQRDGIPPFRALSLDYPTDKETWGLDQQFMIGDTLLAAPLRAGEGSKHVYLPAGTWYEFISGKQHRGGSYLHIKDPDLDYIPLFVKEGSILPLSDPDVAAIHGRTSVNWHIYAHKQATGTLYEDAGDGFGYQRGQYHWYQLSWSHREGLRIVKDNTRSTGWCPLYEFADALIVPEC